MSQILYKHRLAEEAYAIDFAAKLNTGETLTNPTVAVLRRLSTGAWQDVTPEFRAGAAVPEVDGTLVKFKLIAATGTDQPERKLGGRLVPHHALLVEADTSEGEHLVALDEVGAAPRLIVTADAVAA